MQIYELTLQDLLAKLSKKEISSPEIVESCLNRINMVDGQVQAFLTVTGDLAVKQAQDYEKKYADKVLKGIPYALKDDICTNGVRTTSASKMLENFIPQYDATVVKLLQEQGGSLLGKLNMDEMSMGVSSEQSAFHPTCNPWDLKRVAGGSSGGAAAAVAADEIPFALGTDANGAIRQPASFCGVVGFKPTYGRVSRLGVIAYASSLEQVGVLSKNVADSATVMNIIAGKDPYDTTSVDIPVPDYTALDADMKGMKIGFPKEFFHKDVDAEVKAAVLAALKQYEARGAIVEEISLPHSEYALPAYYIIACAEASTNLAKLDGVQLGLCDTKAENIWDLYSNSRAMGLGDEVKQRIMFGTYVLSAGQYEKYYLQALKVRRLVHDDFVKVFKDFDLIISPATAGTAPKLGETPESALSYINDILTIPVNMAGLPAISVPCGLINNLPMGMQIIGKPFAEGTILKAAYAFEQMNDYYKQKPSLGVY